MQKVTRKEILPGTYLTCVSSTKFKTGFITVNLITRLEKKTASKNALIPYVLRRGTTCCPDIQSLARELDELYGATIEPIIRKSGERQCIGLYSVFADDDFLPKGSDVLEKITALLGEMLTSPYTKGGLLYGEYVESEKKNLIEEIRASINDKRTYAVTRLWEGMCDGEDYGVIKLGDEVEKA
ncbi:MAG: insulinase family protein, partial [Oscillospiraceae bacterium]|nr:insulinase family protein [Oscillospiraceae bacterium]